MLREKQNQTYWRKGYSQWIFYIKWEIAMGEVMLIIYEELQTEKNKNHETEIII